MTDLLSLQQSPAFKQRLRVHLRLADVHHRRRVDLGPDQPAKSPGPVVTVAPAEDLLRSRTTNAQNVQGANPRVANARLARPPTETPKSGAATGTATASGGTAAPSVIAASGTVSATRTRIVSGTATVTATGIGNATGTATEIVIATVGTRRTVTGTAIGRIVSAGPLLRRLRRRLSTTVGYRAGQTRADTGAVSTMSLWGSGAGAPRTT